MRPVGWYYSYQKLARYRTQRFAFRYVCYSYGHHIALLVLVAALESGIAANHALLAVQYHQAAR
eukprot:scaffold488355_cov21-Prasinocladus_malaysianus.AAC.1